MVIIVVTFFGMLATLQGYKEREEKRYAGTNPLATADRGINTNVPMLQAKPVEELQHYLDREQARLTTSAEYTTPTGEKKFHIPVDHAMDLVLDSLNNPPPPPAPEPEPAPAPAEGPAPVPAGGAE